MKNQFPTFGNGNEKNPNFREWETAIPGNGREREFPLTPGEKCPLTRLCDDRLQFTIYFDEWSRDV